MAAGQSPWVRAWTATWAERRRCLWRTAMLRQHMRLAALYKCWNYFYLQLTSTEHWDIRTFSDMRMGLVFSTCLTFVCMFLLCFCSFFCPSVCLYLSPATLYCVNWNKYFDCTESYIGLLLGDRVACVCVRVCERPLLDITVGESRIGDLSIASASSLKRVTCRNILLMSHQSHWRPTKTTCVAGGSLRSATELHDTRALT